MYVCVSECVCVSVCVSVSVSVCVCECVHDVKRVTSGVCIMSASVRSNVCDICCCDRHVCGDGLSKHPRLHTCSTSYTKNPAYMYLQDLHRNVGVKD